jgi:hypothetical protein
MANQFLTGADDSISEISAREGLKYREEVLPVLIDIGGKVETPHVVRDGREIPVVAIEEEKLEEYTQDKAKQVTVVLKQSIKPGTRVPKGTAVELTLAPPSDIPGNIVTGGHKGLAGATMGQMQQLYFEDRALEQAISAHAKISDMDPGEKQVLSDALEANGVPIVAGDPTQDLEAALTMLRAVYAFTGGSGR